MNQLADQRAEFVNESAVDATVAIFAGKVPCVAWPEDVYAAALRQGARIWLPYDVSGVQFADAYLSIQPKDKEAFLYQPRMCYPHQQLVLMDLKFLPPNLNYVGELFSLASSKPNLTWIPVPKNLDLESWFVARDKAARS